MKDKILGNKIYKNMLYTMLINIAYIILYKIIGAILPSNYEFREWVYVLFLVNILVLIILILVFLNILFRLGICTKIKNDLGRKGLKVLSIVGTVLSIGICLVVVFVVFAFTYAPEHTVKMQGQEVIAKVEAGLTRTSISYYEPVNIFVMKGSTIQGEEYKGSFDKFDDDK